MPKSLKENLNATTITQNIDRHYYSNAPLNTEYFPEECLKI